MNITYSPYALFLLIAVCASIAFALYAWRRRAAPGGTMFAILMLAVFQLLLSHSLQLASADQSTRIFWAQAAYLGMVTIPVIWMLFAMSYTLRSRWISRRNVALLLVIPTITLVLVWTNPWHQLIWSSVGVISQGIGTRRFARLTIEYGPWFWLHLVYSYALVATGTGLLISRMIRAPRMYRRQIATLLVGVLVPSVANYWYITNRSLPLQADLMPFMFTLIGIAFAWSLFRFRLLDLTPVARDAIFESMYAGVIVLDTRRRIVDVNPAAERFFGWQNVQVIGQDLVAVMPELAKILPQSSEGKDIRTIVTLQYGAEARVYELNFIYLRNRYSYAAGSMAVLRDVTSNQEAEAALRENEARYRVVSELTSDFTYVLSVDRRGKLKLDWITDAFYRITDLTEQEVKNLGGWRSLIHKEDLQITTAHARKLFTGHVDIAEFRLITKAGETIWIRNYGQPEWDESHQRVLRILGAGQNITEQKRVEAALRESEERYRLLFESNPNPMWVYDVETLAFLTINEEAVRTYGYTREEFLSMRLTDLLPEHGVSVLIQPQIQADGSTQMADIWQHRKKDGSIIDVEIRTHALNFAGRPAQAMLANDVTTRQQAENALRESEERYRRLVEYSPEPIAVYSEGKVMYANAAAIKLYGASKPEDLIGRSVVDFVPLDRRDNIPVLNPAHQRSSRPPQIVEEKLLRIDGESIDIEIATIPTTYLDKPATQVVARDITARKRVEEALRQQNEYFAALHDTALAVMNRLEVEDVLETIVVRAGALVGTEHGYLYSGDPGSGTSEIKVGVGMFRSYVGQPLRPGIGVDGMVWLTGQPLAVNNYQDWFWRIQDEGLNSLKAVMGVPLTSGSQIVGVLGLAHLEEGRSFGDEEIAILARFAELASIALDNARLYTTAQQELAERKHAEEKLAYARDEALEAARLKSEFLATMSHELRTPLNAIIGFTDLTLEPQIGPLNEQQRSNLQRVSRNARNLLDLIDGILDLSKIDAGRMQMSSEPVRLYEVVSSAVSNIETLVTNKQLQVTIEQPTSLPLIYSDSGRLRQIVLNLLSNAVKFTPAHGRISVFLEYGSPAALEAAALPIGDLPPGDWIALSVQDTGIGIPPEEHGRIWNEFYQIDGSTTRQYSGTGLGLTIVRRLTELMGGQVGLRSVIGEGSTFTIWLPVPTSSEVFQAASETQSAMPVGT